jgi:hypothetical protein
LQPVNGGLHQQWSSETMNVLAVRLAIKALETVAILYIVHKLWQLIDKALDRITSALGNPFGAESSTSGYDKQGVLRAYALRMTSSAGNGAKGAAVTHFAISSNSHITSRNASINLPY